MKSLRIILLGAMAAVSAHSFAQSESFQTLKDNFAGQPEVHCFKVSGFLCRTVLWMAGEWEFREAISDVSSIRIMTIPKEAFASQQLSLGGFRRVLQKDRYESLATVRDNGERVEVYIQEAGNRNNRYLVLVEESDEVTVIEVKGSLDLQKLKEIDEKNSVASM